MQIYQRVDLLYIAYFSHLGAKVRVGKHTEQLDIYRHFVLANTGQIVDKRNCYLGKIGLWSGQIAFIIVLLYGFYRVSQLTIIIIILINLLSKTTLFLLQLENI